VLRISNLTLARGTRRLLEGASLTVHAGHKVGLVGANGCGKSSLFAAILHEGYRLSSALRAAEPARPREQPFGLMPDAGSLELPASWTIAHVAQETPATGRSAIDYVLDGDPELRQIESGLASAETDDVALADLHHRYETIGGYGARARAAMLLAGLGFEGARHADPVASFSGGWRMRLNLAQALQSRSDLLLLDEPTNHLDLDAVLWLEDWLGKYPGTLLLITHDRDFLDGVVDSIVHIDNRRLASYTGNYAQFEVMRAQQLALQQATFAKQQRQIAHLQSFVDRFRAKATKAKQAQSRIKAIERMELIAAAHVDSPFEFAFAPAASAARQLVLLEDVSLGYEGHAPVLEGLDFGILGGERVGLLGPNGAGKSTLLKAIGGTLAPLAGERRTAQTLRVGYFAQHQVEQLRGEHSPLWHLRRLEPDTREQEHRDFLGGFDFRGQMVTEAVSQFSGGEKARLTLALIVRQKPNLLLLDEPTNHLDIEMREALTEALQDYDGALVVVAHDRHLLRATTDALWIVVGGKVAPFDGDLDDYRDWVLSQRRGEPAEERRTDDRKARKREEAQARQRLSDARKPLLAKAAAIEREMEALVREKDALDAWLASEGAYAAEARDTLKERIARQGELTWQLARLETEWLENSERLDNTGNDS
jgi:ATP-binding cassette subfamily F protein 3